MTKKDYKGKLTGKQIDVLPSTIEENEEIVAAAIAELDESKISEKDFVEDKNVIVTALNDLNSKVSKSVETDEKSKQITFETTATHKTRYYTGTWNIKDLFRFTSQGFRIMMTAVDNAANETLKHIIKTSNSVLSILTDGVLKLRSEKSTYITSNHDIHINGDNRVEITQGDYNNYNGELILKSDGVVLGSNDGHAVLCVGDVSNYSVFDGHSFNGNVDGVCANNRGVVINSYDLRSHNSGTTEIVNERGAGITRISQMDNDDNQLKVYLGSKRVKLGVQTSENTPIDKNHPNSWIDTGIIIDKDSIRFIQNGEEINVGGGGNPEDEQVISAALNALRTHKIERVELVCDDNQTITLKGSTEALTYEQIKKLVDDTSKFVTLRYMNMWWMLPAYDDGGAIMFTSSDIEGAHPTTTRVVINTEGELNNYSIRTEDADHKTEDLSVEEAVDGHLTYPTTKAVNDALNEIQNIIKTLQSTLNSLDTRLKDLESV